MAVHDVCIFMNSLTYTLSIKCHICDGRLILFSNVSCVTSFVEVTYFIPNLKSFSHILVMSFDVHHDFLYHMYLLAFFASMCGINQGVIFETSREHRFKFNTYMYFGR